MVEVWVRLRSRFTDRTAKAWGSLGIAVPEVLDQDRSRSPIEPNDLARSVIPYKAYRGGRKLSSYRSNRREGQFCEVRAFRIRQISVAPEAQPSWPYGPFPLGRSIENACPDRTLPSKRAAHGAPAQCCPYSSCLVASTAASLMFSSQGWDSLIVSSLRSYRMGDAGGNGGKSSPISSNFRWAISLCSR